MTEEQEQRNPVFSRNNDYPMPDPLWDYAEIYHKMQAAKVRLDYAIQLISSFERKDDEATEELILELRQIDLLWRDFCYEPDD